MKLALKLPFRLSSFDIGKESLGRPFLDQAGDNEHRQFDGRGKPARRMRIQVIGVSQKGSGCTSFSLASRKWRARLQLMKYS